MIRKNATDFDNRDHNDMAGYQEDRVRAMKQRILDLEQRNAVLEATLADVLENRSLIEIVGR